MFQVVPCMPLVQESQFFETQQSSDTTYRVYDFDRKDDNGNLRELHLEKTLMFDYIGEPANSRPVTVKADDLRSTLLVSK